MHFTLFLFSQEKMEINYYSLYMLSKCSFVSDPTSWKLERGKIDIEGEGLPMGHTRECLLVYPIILKTPSTHKHSSWLVKHGKYFKIKEIKNAMTQVPSMSLTFLKVLPTHLEDFCKWRLSAYAAYWWYHYAHKLCMTEQFFLCVFQQSKIKQV